MADLRRVHRERWQSQRRWWNNRVAEDRRQWNKARSEWHRDRMEDRRDYHRRYLPGHRYGYGNQSWRYTP